MGTTRKIFIYILASLAIAMLVYGCDTTDPVVLHDEYAGTDSLRLAPGNPDPKFYVTPSTMKYHYANCRDTLGAAGVEKLVMFKSEAIEAGYVPCERCFPLPPEPYVPRVYVLDTGTDYHRAQCPYLDDTKTVILLADAIGEGYQPCRACYYELAAFLPPKVLVDLETGVYHRGLCPDLTGDEVVMIKSEAIEAGYLPHECAIDVRISGGIVYYCPIYGEKYHGYNCFYLDQCVEGTVTMLLVWNAWRQGLTACSYCNGRPVEEDS